MVEVREYLDGRAKSSFARWFNKLNAVAAARVTIALMRIGQGNMSNCKNIGGGIAELKIDFGPGYRIYFGKDGDYLIILLGGGIKKRQQDDIEKAKTLWKDYKRRKRKEE